MTLVTSQTFTMGKKCRASLEAAQTSLTDQEFETALNAFTEFSSECKTKDAKEAGAAGRAEALNGLGRYPEAIEEADLALKVTKNRSLMGHFQKAIAQSNLGDIEASKKSFQQVLNLTEKNENIAARASNYSIMAALYDRQLQQTDSAQYYLEKAKALDPGNIDYVIQEGSMYAGHKKYTKAFDSYDAAALINPNSQMLYEERANTRLKMMSEKYGTSKAQELRTKMSQSEKTALCEDLNKALSLGLQDMNKDMFAALVCN